MKRFVPLLGLLLMLACGSGPKAGQEPLAEGEYIAEYGQPVDLGLIREADGELSFTLLYLNQSGHDLVPDHGVPSCGCVTVDLQKDTVRAGEYHRIPVRFNPSYKQGRITERIAVSYTDGYLADLLFAVEVRPGR